MKKTGSGGRAVFADPTHKRIFVFSAIVLALALALVYLKLYYPNTLLWLRYSVLNFRFSTVVLFNQVFLALMALNFVKLFAYAFAAKKPKRRAPGSAPGNEPAVTAVIPAYNEEKTIVDTVRSVLRSDYKNLDVIVVDDGSKDETLKILRAAFGKNRRVTILTQENTGKSGALNNGIAAATGELLFLLDADTTVAPNAVSLLVPHFEDPRVAAVSGNTRVGNAKNFITWFQRVEYIRDFNLLKNGMSRFNAQAVVPGALGLWRKSAVLECGGFSSDTLGEDRDLAMALLKKGYKTEFEAMAFSETQAPYNMKNFVKQRFRWTYATLQCERKYLSCLMNPFKKGLGLLLMPDLVIFQTVLPLVTTVGFIVNLMYYDAFQFKLLAVSYALSVCVEILLFLLAWRITREKIYFRDILCVIPQRLVYGVVCTFLLYKAALYAFLGVTVLWNKVDRRKNEVSQPEEPGLDT